MMKISQRLLVLLSVMCLASCGSLRSASNPDVTYSGNSSDAVVLQVPPDLTDVSRAEQYVVPGIQGAPVTRGTLLPQFSSMRFVRQGEQSWLAIDAAPADIWQRVLSFARKEKYLIEKTQPIAGAIVTQWRPASAVAKGSLLKNLIGSDEAYTRIAFRIERNGDGARLFARSQKTADKTLTEADTAWPARSHDPESTSEMLMRLLAFLGVEEQKAKGILSTQAANAVLDNATLQTNGSGSELILYRGYQPAFRAVIAALDDLQYPVSSQDDGVGRIEFTVADSSLVIELSPVHFSEVRLAVLDSDGQKLNAQKEQSLLNSLLGRLS